MRKPLEGSKCCSPVYLDATQTFGFARSLMPINRFRCDMLSSPPRSPTTSQITGFRFCNHSLHSCSSSFCHVLRCSLLYFATPIATCSFPFQIIFSLPMAPRRLLLRHGLGEPCVVSKWLQGIFKRPLKTKILKMLKNH